MKYEGICHFCGKFTELVPGWWACAIDICFPCNKARQELATERVKESAKETTP